MGVLFFWLEIVRRENVWENVNRCSSGKFPKDANSLSLAAKCIFLKAPAVSENSAKHSIRPDPWLGPLEPSWSRIVKQREEEKYAVEKQKKQIEHSASRPSLLDYGHNLKVWWAVRWHHRPVLCFHLRLDLDNSGKKGKARPCRGEDYKFLCLPPCYCLCIRPVGPRDEQRRCYHMTESVFTPWPCLYCLGELEEYWVSLL